MEKTKTFFAALVAVLVLAVAPIQKAEATDPFVTPVVIAGGGYLVYNALRGDWNGTAFQKGGVPTDWHSAEANAFCQARQAKGAWLAWSGFLYDFTVGAFFQNPTTQALNANCENIAWGIAKAK